MKGIIIPILATMAFIVIVGLFINDNLNIKMDNGRKSNQIQKTATIEGKVINLEIVETNEERSKGLSGRESLEKDTGMLFIFPENTIPSFWMKDMLIPIDIIWIDNGVIVGIESNVQPPTFGTPDAQLAKYKPRKPIDYVLEVNANFCSENNFKEGNEVTFNF